MKTESPEEGSFAQKPNFFDGQEKKKFYLERLRAGENTHLSEIGYDVIIKVEGYIFKAHQMILEARCEYFRAMFSHGAFQEGSKQFMKEKESTIPVIELKDISADYFYSIHTYIYTDEVVVYRKKELTEFLEQNYQSINSVFMTEA